MAKLFLCFKHEWSCPGAAGPRAAEQVHRSGQQRQSSDAAARKRKPGRPPKLSSGSSKGAGPPLGKNDTERERTRHSLHVQAWARIEFINEVLPPHIACNGVYKLDYSSLALLRREW
jgi:hypothetical protein